MGSGEEEKEEPRSGETHLSESNQGLIAQAGSTLRSKVCTLADNREVGGSAFIQSAEWIKKKRSRADSSDG